MATKICAECGKKYESNYPRSKYCSTNCGHIAEMRKQRERYKAKRKLVERICPVCGNVYTRVGQAKYCSDKCLNKSKLIRQANTRREERAKNPKPRWGETLCWTCQNACGGCSWSKSFTPVEGWKAKPTQIKTVYNDVFEESYRVIECPEYIPDEPRGAKK